MIYGWPYDNFRWIYDVIQCNNLALPSCRMVLEMKISWMNYSLVRYLFIHYFEIFVLLPKAFTVFSRLRICSRVFIFNSIQWFDNKKWGVERKLQLLSSLAWCGYRKLLAVSIVVESITDAYFHVNSFVHAVNCNIVCLFIRWTSA